MVVSSLAAAVICRAGRKPPSAETIAIRPGAKTSWLCRELNGHHTPKACNSRSRLSEKSMPQRNRARVIPPSFRLV
jgi:hypothetical protein